VKTEVTDSGRFERTLTVHLEESELEDAKNKAARKLSQQMKIKGFRPGKAPRALVERMVGADQLRADAIEEAIPGAVTSAVDENGLEPVTVPQVSDIRDAAEGGVDVDVRITLWPELDAIPEYAGREIEVEIPEVTDEEIDQQLDALRNQFAELEVVSRPADEGDFVMINITVLLNGLEVDDASANDLLYEIGSGSFLPGLDEVLVGAAPGDIRECPSTLPDGFGEHGGKPVALRVLIKDVRAKRLPELTDDLVDDATEFETIDELREAIVENMRAMRVLNARAEFEDSVVESVVADLDLEIPEALLDVEVEARAHSFLHRLEQEDVSFPDYLRITGQDEQAFIAELRDQARTALSTRILLEAIVKIEGLEVSEEDYSEAVGAVAARSGSDAEAVAVAIEESGQEASLTGDILRRKALLQLVDSAQPVDVMGSPVDLTPIVPQETSEDDPDDENEVDSEERGDSGQREASPVDEAEPIADENAGPTGSDPAETEE